MNRPDPNQGSITEAAVRRIKNYENQEDGQRQFLAQDEENFIFETDIEIQKI